MKWKVQVASALMLIALVLSFTPATAMPARAPAAQACTDRAQFVADVTVPDGTRYDPGATFKKTWRLRNVGTCTWTTSYTMVFDTGTQMGSTTSVNLTNTAPGQTVDVSLRNCRDGCRAECGFGTDLAGDRRHGRGCLVELGRRSRLHCPFLGGVRKAQPN